MSGTIAAKPLTVGAFAPYGEVLEASGAPDYMINAGLCGRYHDRARPETDPEGEVALSIGRSDAISLPLTLKMMERHPDGSQAFVPMNGTRFLVIVAADENGVPGRPEAFLTNGTQGIQYKRNCWHGVLAPLEGPADFLIVDRIGPGNNLEEHHLAAPYTITAE
ncbi:ureidoglycolate lyase [Nisaea acidiphila]|uniref:Ureidoglycolate lyase n=1 Tax=Nisaea acidiphila TaxID=1862145 RepID=A0A9J7ARL2_9PROT|nr:ureidoglycolate lyase [Nisaea acidiphila]UUX49209.1 ureidoglycolate lyase [Nisaea acidiphila]